MMAKEKNMKETNTKKKDNKENLTEIQELLKQLDSLLTETYETHQYTHTVEITNLSRKLQDKKLNDEFFISNLTEKEKKTLGFALIIANVRC